MTPVVVIVGRPNVGKSTLFNALVGRRRSIVGDEPGITRDRIHGEATYDGKRFEVIDTGGIVPDDADTIPFEILRQARYALDRASQIIFLIDGRTEITGTDRDLARMLRETGKPVTVAVNKVDSPAQDLLAHEFYSLGFERVVPISAEHKLGLDILLDEVTAEFPAAEDAAAERASSIRVAIIGRPNVGKSTLLNALAGQDRAIVSAVAGTTRDAVDETVVHGGTTFVFVDTAGIRRKGKTKLMAEKLSVVMARKHIAMADVVLMVLDATEGVTGLDATIAGYAHEEGRAIVLVVNKWDAMPPGGKTAFTQQIRDEMKFLEYAPVAFVSAQTGAGVGRLFGMARKVYEAASLRITTGELNRFVEQIPFHQDIKVFYMTQGAVRPPTFIVFTDKGKQLHFSTERYIVNQLRKRFGFEGTPITLKSRRR